MSKLPHPEQLELSRLRGYFLFEQRRRLVQTTNTSEYFEPGVVELATAVARVRERRAD